MSAVTFLAILSCVIGISAGQVLFKLASRTISQGQPFYFVLGSPYFLCGIAIYGVATFVWIVQLAKADLSRAYPMMTLSFILVPILSSLFLGETIAPRYWAGLILLLSGLIIMLSSSSSVR